MPSTAEASERSYAPLTDAHLTRLAEIARADREDRFTRRPRWRVYRDRVLLVALCQGAALHYLDGRNGVKDLDVWTFYARHPEGDFPARWRVMADFGPSELGRHPDDAGYRGRHVDLIGRSIDATPGADSVRAVRTLPAHGGHDVGAGARGQGRRRARSARSPRSHRVAHVDLRAQPWADRSCPPRRPCSAPITPPAAPSRHEPRLPPSSTTPRCAAPRRG